MDLPDLPIIPKFYSLFDRDQLLSVQHKANYDDFTLHTLKYYKHNFFVISLLCCVFMAMQNKLNVAPAKFDVISKQIQRSIELITDVSTSFKFSEPIVFDCLSPSIDGISNFEFCEPLKQVQNEETDVNETLFDRLSLLRISDNYESPQSNVHPQHSMQNPFQFVGLDLNNSHDQSNNHTQISSESPLQGDEASSHSQNVGHIDMNKSKSIDRNTQITHLEIDNSAHKTTPAPQKHIDKQPLPLLIKDVHKITWPNLPEVCYVPVMELFGQIFEVVMVYGVVTSLNVEKGGLLQRFVMDDGSDSISVVWKANNDMIELIKNVHDLDEEVKSCRKSGLSVMNENWLPSSKECTEILNNLNHIIHFIKREVTKRTKLKLFGYAAVVGKPVRPPGKGMVTLVANHIEENSGTDRSLELYHKKNLIRLYEEKYKLARSYT